MDRPQIPSSDNRVNRGGSFNNAARNARASNRNNNTPTIRNNNLGVRPSKTSPSPDSPLRARLAVGLHLSAEVGIGCRRTAFLHSQLVHHEGVFRAYEECRLLEVDDGVAEQTAKEVARAQEVDAVDDLADVAPLLEIGAGEEAALEAVDQRVLQLARAQLEGRRPPCRPRP
jgi:hypothetical protein